MLQIPCPWCGPRDQSEFTYAGEAHIVRPKEPDQLSDAEWAEYLFMRRNTEGRYREQWYHAHGCQQFFNAVRDTVTNEIETTYRHDEEIPGEPT
ncbi:MAG TPA: sarcosine oxidase subunit delta [Salinisphaeraceae bacterium]|nr:sarcosine oxidase subunit delta [Salinisphaeraceae bacterium]